MRLPSDADISGRLFGAEELALLREVIESGTLNCTKGTQVKAFEKEFAALYGVPHCRAVTSGTAAMHTTIAAVDPEPGDEIVTTSITDMGALTPILYQGAIPVFADVDPVSLNVTPETIQARLSPRTRAIVVTHIFGNPCDTEAIVALANERGIPVIEDCAQSFLARQNGRLTGTIGDIGALSMQQGKHMTTGEGGMVISSNDAYARRMVLFSDKAWGYGDPNPDHYFLAMNYRMTELQGAVARAQQSRVEQVVSSRQATASMLTAKLADVEGLTLPSTLPGCTHTYWKYPLIVDPNVIEGGSDALGAELKKNGVFCAPRYIQKPAFECQVLRDRVTFGKSEWPFSLRPEIRYDRAEYPGTIQGLDRVVVLPWNEKYTEEHVDFIAGAVRSAVAKLSRVAVAV
jgi:dTDP-4-amino-4,6-dideoxygalactose transaminase